MNKQQQINLENSFVYGSHQMDPRHNQTLPEFTKVVFVSRHEPSAEQLEILRNVYPGLEIETRAIVFGPGINSLSDQLKEANWGGEIWVVVAPSHHVIHAWSKGCIFGTFSNKPSARGAGQFDVENYFEYNGQYIKSLNAEKNAMEIYFGG